MRELNGTPACSRAAAALPPPPASACRLLIAPPPCIPWPVDSGGKDSCYNMMLCQQYGHEARGAVPCGSLDNTAALHSCRRNQPCHQPHRAPPHSANRRSWCWATCCRHSRRLMTWTATCTRRWVQRCGFSTAVAGASGLRGARMAGGVSSCGCHASITCHHAHLSPTCVAPHPYSPAQPMSPICQVGHQVIAAYAQCMRLPLYRRRITGGSADQRLVYEDTEGALRGGLG